MVLLNLKVLGGKLASKVGICASPIAERCQVSSFTSKLESKLGLRQRPLKELALVIYRLRPQRNKIESMSLMMQRRDKEFFDKCLAARAAGDMPRANLYAEECAEVRKIAKIVLNSELALEQLILKLETAEMLGDIAFLVHPIKGVVATIGEQLQHLLPDVSFELSQINKTLDGLIINVGDVTESMALSVSQSSEAENIMREADTLAEQKMKSRFPELHATPSAVQT